MLLFLLLIVRTYWLLITFGLLIAIASLSLIPAPDLTIASGNDKINHIIAYCCLVLPTVLRKPSYWLIIVLGFIGLSGLVELIQPYVNRQAEWLDLLANTTGVSLGVLLGSLINRLAIHNVNKPPSRL